MASEYQRVRDYELMVILHPELSDEDVVAELDAIQGLVTAQEGEIRLVNGESPWGRRRLSYAIRHGSRDLKDGIYVLIYFSALSTVLAEIERDIKLDDRIIRYLLVQQGAPMMEPVVEEEVAEGEATEGTAAATEAAPDGEATPDTTDEPAAVVEEAASEPEVAVEAPAEESAVAETVDETPAEEAVADRSKAKLRQATRRAVSGN